MKLIYIKWCDATSNETSWKTQEEALAWADNEDWTVESVGWLLKETKEYILLSLKKSMDLPDLYPQYGCLFKIPKTWIRKRKTLKV